MKATQIILASRPNGVPTLDNFKFEDISLPELKEDEILLKPLYISVDPYMRGRMRDAESYVPSFKIGEPITGGSVAMVKESNSPKFQKGDTVISMLPWSTYSIQKDDKVRKIETTNIPVSYYLGVLGMPGMTAYF